MTSCPYSRPYVPINAHAPSEDKEENVKNAFHNKLDKNTRRPPKIWHENYIRRFQCKNKKKIIFQPTIGKYSVHEESTVISSTYFLHKRIHKQTWRSPNGNILNQNDHVLFSARHVKNIQDIKRCRGASIASDYYLVRIRLIDRVLQKWDCSRLKETDILDKYQNKINILKYIQALLSMVTINCNNHTPQTKERHKQTMVRWWM